MSWFPASGNTPGMLCCAKYLLQTSRMPSRRCSYSLSNGVEHPLQHTFSANAWRLYTKGDEAVWAADERP
jgi:hypothetical protein